MGYECSDKHSRAENGTFRTRRRGNRREFREMSKQGIMATELLNRNGVKDIEETEVVEWGKKMIQRKEKIAIDLVYKAIKERRRMVEVCNNLNKLAREQAQIITLDAETALRERLVLYKGRLLRAYARAA